MSSAKNVQEISTPSAKSTKKTKLTPKTNSSAKNVKTEQPLRRQADEITDPNFLTYLSSCIKEVHTSEARVFKPFSQRLKDVETRKTALPEEEATQVDLFVQKMDTFEDQTDLHSALESQAGFKCLISVKSPEQLFAYCEILGVSEEDFDHIFNDPNEPATALSKLSLLMALGIWYRAMQEKEARGVCLEENVKTIMERIYDRVGGTTESGEPKSDSFESGLNFARRILSGLQVERKRGRRPKNYFAQYDGIKADVSAEETSAQLSCNSDEKIGKMSPLVLADEIGETYFLKAE